MDVVEGVVGLGTASTLPQKMEMDSHLEDRSERMLQS